MEDEDGEDDDEDDDEEDDEDEEDIDEQEAEVILMRNHDNDDFAANSAGEDVPLHVADDNEFVSDHEIDNDARENHNGLDDDDDDDDNMVIGDPPDNHYDYEQNAEEYDIQFDMGEEDDYYDDIVVNDENIDGDIDADQDDDDDDDDDAGQARFDEDEDFFDENDEDISHHMWNQISSSTPSSRSSNPSRHGALREIQVGLGVDSRGQIRGIRVNTDSGETDIMRTVDEELSRRGAVRVQIGATEGANVLDMLGSLMSGHGSGPDFSPPSWEASLNGNEYVIQARRPIRLHRTSNASNFPSFLNDMFAPPGSSSERRSNRNQTTTSSGGTTLHPLLSASDGRRGRLGHGSGRGTSIGDIFGSFISSIYNGGSSSGTTNSIWGDYNDDTSRQNRTVFSSRRKGLGPLVSDRRWGTDVGEIEPVGSRLPILGTAVESVLQDIIEDEKDEQGVSESHLTRKDSISSLNNNLLTGRNSNILMSTAASDIEEDIRQIMRSGASFTSEMNDDRFHDELVEEMAVVADSDDDDDDDNQSDPSPEGEADNEMVDGAVMDIQHEEDLEETADLANATISAPVELTSAEIFSVTDTYPTAQALMEVSVSQEQRAETVGNESTTQSTGELIRTRASLCPPDTEEEVWAALPLDMQIEFLNSIGRHADAHELFNREVEACGVDRDVIMSLPPELRTQALCEEQTERRRRSSSVGTSEFSISSDVPALEPHVQSTSSNNDSGSGSGGVVLASSTTSQNDANIFQTSNITSRIATTATMSENALFVESLPPELRHDVLLSAEEQFLLTLPDAMRQEARALRESHAFHIQLNSLNDDIRGATGSGGSVDFAQSIIRPGASDLNDLFNDIHRSDDSRRSGDQNYGTLASRSSHQRESPPLYPTVVNLGEDRLNTDLPYRKDLIIRLCRTMIVSSRSKYPRPLMRLLAVCCRYKAARCSILRTLFAALFHDTELMVSNLNRIACSSTDDTTTVSAATNQTASFFQSECDKVKMGFSMLSKTGAISYSRKLLSTLNYLVRKTDRLVWFDIFVRESDKTSVTVSLENSDYRTVINEWMFAAVFELMDDSKLEISGVVIDSVLSLLEVLCSPLGHLTVAQANELVPKYMKTKEASASPIDASVVESKSERDDNSKNLKKRKVDEDIHSTSAADVQDADDKSDDVDKHKIVDRSDVEELIPFPVITIRCARILASLASNQSCAGLIRKKLLRILMPLSLYDSNWILLLQQLSVSGKSVQSLVLEEMVSVNRILNEVKERKGDVIMALSHSQLSSPQHLPELQLLQILRIISSLRSSKIDQLDVGDISQGDIAHRSIISTYMSELNCEPLWDFLCDSLDIVRDLEGLVDESLEDDEMEYDEDNDGDRGGSGFSSGHKHSSRSIASPHSSRKRSKKETKETSREESEKHEKQLKQKENIMKNKIKNTGVKKLLPTLTMRFMALIECYFTVCGVTLLHLPTIAKAQAEASVLKGKDTNNDSSSTSLPSVTENSTNRSLGCIDSSVLEQSASMDMSLSHNEGVEKSVESTALSFLSNRHNVLLGARFRAHDSYWRMQMELDDSVSSKRLKRFTQRNRILLNIILRQNIALLDTSFSPLITAPACRQLLHFDVKRAYFKMKLKKMKLSGTSYV
jgi:hypothetical protein